MPYILCTNPNCSFKEPFVGDKPVTPTKYCPRCGRETISACPIPECKSLITEPRQKYCKACGQMLKLEGSPLGPGSYLDDDD